MNRDLPVSNTAPDFDRLAKLYRWMEWASFGPWLQRCRNAFLPALNECSRALILGDGDGRFTSALLRANARIEIDAVDASGAMLRELLRRAAGNAKRVRTQTADIRKWQPGSDGYDLVVSHFILDCLTTDEISLLALKLRGVTTPSALWVISEFAIPENTYGRLVAGPLIAILYRAFGALTGLDARRLPDHRTAIRSAGFELIDERRLLGGLLLSELWRNAGS